MRLWGLLKSWYLLVVTDYWYRYRGAVDPSLDERRVGR